MQYFAAFMVLLDSSVPNSEIHVLRPGHEFVLNFPRGMDQIIMSREEWNFKQDQALERSNFSVTSQFQIGDTPEKRANQSHYKFSQLSFFMYT